MAWIRRIERVPDEVRVRAIGSVSFDEVFSFDSRCRRQYRLVDLP
jgi:hypothetical protein